MLSSRNSILDQITGMAIIDDGNIIYQSGDYLKVVELENPEKVLCESKSDYKFVHLERMPFGNIVHLKDHDTIKYIPLGTKEWEIETGLLSDISAKETSK